MRIAASHVGCIHIVGIGGIGMSGLAEILIGMGYEIQGSDSCHNKNTKRLQDKGVTIFIGQESQNIANAKIVAISSAISANNPEVVAAQAAGIPVVCRAEILAAIMAMKSSIAVSGSHGKTTTTSLTASALDQIDCNPTVISGGIIKAYGTNAKLGHGDWILVEADESDGTFTKIPAQIGVVTNIDTEHLDYYGNFAKLQQAFLTFIENLPFYGIGFISADCPVCQQLFSNFTNRKILTFGTSPSADIRGVVRTITPQHTTYTVTFSEKACRHWNLPFPTDAVITLPMHGDHNMVNSLAGIAVALECGASITALPALFSTFEGVDRRFSYVGTAANCTLIDDYAHHPAEIEKVFETATQLTTGRVLLVTQPHRYSRLQSLMERYVSVLSKAEYLFILPLYTAGEAPLPGIDSATLAAHITEKSPCHVACPTTREELAASLRDVIQPGDIILFTGAGDITQWATDLLPLLDPHHDGLAPTDAAPANTVAPVIDPHTKISTG